MNNYPLNYPLNLNNVKKFIEKSEPSIVPYIETLLNNTTHIPFELFISYIIKNLKHLLNSKYITNRPLFIYIDTSQDDYIHKSNYWLYMYIENIIKNYIEVIFIDKLDDEQLQPNDTVMLIDDCLYSGGQMASTIGNMETNFNLNFILFICFMSKVGKKLVESTFYKNKDLHSSNLVLPEYIYIIEPITKFMSVEKINKVMDYYYFTTPHIRYPIYFDHKLADNVSSFPEIYSGIVPNDKNRKRLKDIATLSIQMHRATSQEEINRLIEKQEKLKKNISIYPLFKNCEKIRNLDFRSPICPFPPYKQDYNKFIKKLAKRKTTVYNNGKRRSTNGITISKNIYNSNTLGTLNKNTLNSKKYTPISVIKSKTRYNSI